VSMGAYVAGANEEQQKALSKYGENIGFAFQIRDDILNVISPQHVTGKSMLSDISLKRCTYPLIRAFEISPKEEQEKCLRALVEADLDYVLTLIKKTDSIRYSTKLAHTYIEKAKAALIGMDFKNEDVLNSVADFILSRIH
ncbi:MAG: polyprenyl synthetase family protein, partial [Candidatus Thorarchaeota archaeon]